MWNMSRDIIMWVTMVTVHKYFLSTDLLVSLSLHDGLTHDWETDGYISWYCAVYIINVPPAPLIKSYMHVFMTTTLYSILQV